MRPKFLVLLLCFFVPSGGLYAQWGRGGVLSGGGLEGGLAIDRFYPLSGTVGQEVVITGSGFLQSGNQVFFGASISVTSYDVSAGGTELRVIVPEHARSGRIRIVTRMESAFSSAYFNLDPLTMVRFSPDTVTHGDPIHIIGTGFSVLTQGNYVRFQGYIGNVYPYKVDREGTEMTLFVPKDAETGEISITTRGETIYSHRDLIIREKEGKEKEKGEEKY